PETLVRNADTAMYRAKDQGRDNYQLYAPAMNARALERLALENMLRKALSHRDFVLFYQPVVDINSKNIVGVEALIRWKHLELEITESNAMQNAENTIYTLRELKALGVRISMDDFGTGYSSLNYLKRFPIDTLKLDQSFVREITSSPTDAAIATAVIAMAHTLNLKVIGEGVEKEDQFEFLQKRGCDYIQGYLFSPP